MRIFVLIGGNIQFFEIPYSLPVAYRLFLPEVWANDHERRRKAGVPETVQFQTKPEIALDQIKQAMADGIAPGVVLADAAYGNNFAWRTALNDLGLTYCVGSGAATTVWPPGKAPPQPRQTMTRGRPRTRQKRDGDHQPVSVKELAHALKPDQWHNVTWRQGTNGPLRSRFAAVRVHPAHRDYLRSKPHPQEWLLIEWPEGDEEPAKYWFANHAETIALKDLVDIAKLRWRIERDYQDLKQELGLNHYEGRSWRGFHHHATLTIAAYGFLILEADAFSPSRRPRHRTGSNGIQRQKPALPHGFRPRGSAAAA